MRNVIIAQKHFKKLHHKSLIRQSKLFSAKCQGINCENDSEYFSIIKFRPILDKEAISFTELFLCKKHWEELEVNDGKGITK